MWVGQKSIDFVLYFNVDFTLCRDVYLHRTVTSICTVSWRRLCTVRWWRFTSYFDADLYSTVTSICTVLWRALTSFLIRCTAHHYTARVNVLTACYLLQQMTHVTSNYKRVLCKHVLPILQYIKHSIEVVIQINHLFSLCQSFPLVIMYISHMFLYQRKCMDFYENASLHVYQDGIIFKIDCKTDF